MGVQGMAVALALFWQCCQAGGRRGTWCGPAPITSSDCLFISKINGRRELGWKMRMNVQEKRLHGNTLQSWTWSQE